MKKFSYLFIVLIYVSYSCNSDEKVSSQNPLKTYLTTAGFTESESFIDDGDYEFGFRFIPLTNGTMKSVIVKIPDDRTDLRVTLWDAESKTILTTITIPSVTADVELKHSITPILLTKDKEFMITFNSDDYYYRTRADEGDATYPINSGSISITGYGYSSTADQIYPYSFNTNYYAGDLSFQFTPAD